MTTVIAGIRERANEVRQTAARRQAALNLWAEMPTRTAEDTLDRLSDELATWIVPLTDDNATLLAHVDELTERVAALEAALRPFADIWNVYGKSGRIDYETAIMSFVRFPYDGSQVDAAFKQAADALEAENTRLRDFEKDYRALAAQVASIDSAGDVQIDDLEAYYGEQADMAQVRLTALIAVTTLAGIHDRRVREQTEAAALASARGRDADGSGEAGA